MKHFLFVTLFLLYACESTNVTKDIKKNTKNKGIQMKATVKPSIKIKK
tara:strand:- start:476 stop:619 length:144 start_codon:yes stop_codon:yes gene_type:complete